MVNCAWANRALGLLVEVALQGPTTLCLEPQIRVRPQNAVDREIVYIVGSLWGQPAQDELAKGPKADLELWIPSKSC